MDSSEPQAWLVQINGRAAGTRHDVKEDGLTAGRGSDNDLIVSGEDCSGVSKRHVEIVLREDRYLLRDLGSTNGTFLEGRSVEEAALEDGAHIMLGPGGPQFVFYCPSPQDAGQDSPASGSEEQKTTILPALPTLQKAGGRRQESDSRLDEALRKARQAWGGASGQTLILMRGMLSDTLHRSRRLKWAAAAMGIALVLVSLYAFWSVRQMERQKGDLDARIQQIETELRRSGDPQRVDALIAELEQVQNQAREIQRSLLYQLGVRDEERDFVESAIRHLLTEFGAEQYSVPPDFIDAVRDYIERFQQRDRRNVQRALIESRQELQRMQQILGELNLPPDLAFIPLVESAFQGNSTSHAGAAGYWQLVPLTARAYGLEVSESLDERFDLEKSTRAAGRYLRDLILEFGSGSSVMLALAAYNVGSTRVRRAVRRVDDPLRQRNFWYLYRSRALPRETRSYVPKVIAAILIGRHPERFGFEDQVAQRSQPLPIAAQTEMRPRSPAPHLPSSHPIRSEYF